MMDTDVEAAVLIVELQLWNCILGFCYKCWCVSVSIKHNNILLVSTLMYLG